MNFTRPIPFSREQISDLHKALKGTTRIMPTAQDNSSGAAAPPIHNSEFIIPNSGAAGLPAAPIARPGTYAGCILCHTRHDINLHRAWAAILPIHAIGICFECAPSVVNAMLQAAHSSDPARAEHALDILSAARIMQTAATYTPTQLVLEPDEATLKLERVLTIARRHLALLKGIDPAGLDPRSRTHYEYSTILTHLILDDAGSAGVPPACIESDGIQ